jgi:predicted KAP-like P-loop ATPase
MSSIPISLPADSAKNDPESEDRLGRSGFCKVLARVLANGNSTGSSVLAIYGNWGVGKTTVKNFALHYLRHEHGIVPIEFEPWQWSGRDRVIDALFSAIESSLGKQNLRDAEKRFKALTRVLGVTVPTLDFVQLVLPSVVAVIAGGLVYFGISFTLSLRQLPEAIIALGIGLLGLLKSVHAIAKALSEYYANAREARCEALDDARDSLVKELQKRKKPLVIVIDDIDRLEASEIRQVIQTVKAVSNLPNVVYLLLFQREVVEKALEEVAGDGNGAQFLEKAILVGFHVPEPPPGRIMEMLDESIAERRRDSEFSRHWDDARWQDIVKPSLHSFFRTARDVIRFGAALQVYVEQHRHNNALEVNPIDLIALETIRMFEPNLFERLARFPIVGPSQLLPPMATDEELEKKAHLELSELLELTTKAHKSSIPILLKAVFPHLAALSGNETAEITPNWDRDLRICHPLYYSRYFDLALAANRVTDREFQTIVENSGSIEGLRAQLEALKKKKLLPDFVARFFPRISDIPPENLSFFVRALAEEGESLPDMYEEAEDAGSKDNALALAYQALKQMADNGQRREALRSLLELSPSLDFGVHLVAAINSAEKKNDPMNQPLLPAADIAELVPIALRRIRNEAKNGLLPTHPWFTRHLYRWADWGGVNETKAWVATYVTDGPAARAFIDRWTSRIVRTGKTVQYVPCLDGEGLDRIVGFDFLDQLLAKPITGKPNSPSEEIALKLYDKAKELKAAGQQSKNVNFEGI